MKNLGLAFLLLFSGACSKTATGTGYGFGGQLKVSLTAKDGKIVKITAQPNNESDYVGGRAIALLEPQIIINQSPEIDSISGASYSSFGYKAAVADAMKKVGLQDYTITMDTKSPTPVVPTNGTAIETEVLVIGGGGAGLTAAISAAEAGSQVILIEKMPLLGGNTLFSTGGLNAAETQAQKDADIEDTKQLFYEDTMKGGKNLNDAALVKILTEEAADSIVWLKERGIDLSKVTILGGSSKPRAHLPAGGSAVGPYLFNGLEDLAKKLNIDVRPNTKAVALNISGGKIVSVDVQSDTTIYTIKAKAVVIATGGFGGNLNMAASYNPKLKGFGSSNQKGAEGDIFAVLTKMGIALRDMDQIQIHPTGEAARSYLITEAVRGVGAILVNTEGKRFINEIGTRDVVSAAVLKQPSGVAYIVYDNQVRSNLGAIKAYEKLGMVRMASNIVDLSKMMGVPEAELQASIDSYNNAITGQTDPTGRDKFGKTIMEKPFSAIAIKPVIHHTMGGVVVNTNSQVMTTSRQPVKGLFAAGEVVGGVHGANRLGGNAVADIITFGRRSGKFASEYAKIN